MADNGNGKPFLGVPTPLWNTILATVATIVISWMQIRTQTQIEKSGDKTDKVVARATEAVTEVKTAVVEKASTTERKLDSIARVGKESHVLVNDAMSAQLKVNAELSRAKADLTKDPVDEAAAVLAERLLQEHQAKQTSE